MPRFATRREGRRRMTDLSGTVADRLAHFIAATRWGDLPPALPHEAKRALLTFLGTALGAASDPAVAAAVRVLQPLAGLPQAGLIGRAERMDVLSASFVNALAAN